MAETEKKSGRYPWGNGTPSYEMCISEDGTTIDILKPNYHFLDNCIRVEIPTNSRDILEREYPGILLNSGKDGEKFGWCYVGALLRKDELEALKELACQGALFESISLKVVTDYIDNAKVSALVVNGYLIG